MSFKNLILSFIQKKSSFSKKIGILPLDLKKPWWAIIFEQKLYMAFIIFAVLVSEIFKTLFPILIGVVIDKRSALLFIAILFIWILVLLLDYYKKIFNGILFSRIVASIQYHAHKFFIIVDPIYHAYRVSGTIIGKINRTAYAYEDLLDSLEDIFPTIVGVLSVIISTSLFDLRLGIITFFLLLIFSIFSSYIITIIILEYEKTVNKADDALKAVSIESLAQVNLIRSVFASSYIIKKIESKHNNLMESEIILYSNYNLVRLGFWIFYVIILGIFGFYVLNLIKIGKISPIMGSTLILTYLRGTGEILKLANPIRYFLRSYSRITDFYEFIKTFGRQTYPVLEHILDDNELEKIKSESNIDILADNIYFDYFSGARIFDGHSLHLNLPKSENNKLYGIIGPSGAGKTTFISIFGGQLKPAQGKILINGIDIYNIGDHERKSLICMQGQIATNLRGTLQYNLLFGLPEYSTIYSDELLINILEAVGLWSLFKDKNGLQTLIGEGGLNLSGGQRQRLNFASLYLRAQYYKPLLILIDEPTSSLDEVSERAITRMILTLAKNAVTFVIAHRIKTLSDAVGILDFSLFGQEKQMKFYKTEELLQKSEYYKNLIAGKVPIEE
ncbi:ABC transporter ATP-binding protein/permease [Candidatus Dependentiae bacterium]|nr:ABC transporter ATP-binding protein/permease [Candidatus Dependentiae bacterium]